MSMRCISFVEYKQIHTKLLKIQCSYFYYRASDVILTQDDLIHSQFRLVVIDILNCDVNFDK